MSLQSQLEPGEVTKKSDLGNFGNLNPLLLNSALPPFENLPRSSLCHDRRGVGRAERRCHRRLYREHFRFSKSLKFRETADTWTEYWSLNSVSNPTLRGGYAGGPSFIAVDPSSYGKTPDSQVGRVSKSAWILVSIVEMVANSVFALL